MYVEGSGGAYTAECTETRTVMSIRMFIHTYMTNVVLQLAGATLACETMQSMIAEPLIGYMRWITELKPMVMH